MPDAGCTAGEASVTARSGAGSEVPAHLAGRGAADHDPPWTPINRAAQCSGPPHPTAHRRGALVRSQDGRTLPRAWQASQHSVGQQATTRARCPVQRPSWRPGVRQQATTKARFPVRRSPSCSGVRQQGTNWAGSHVQRPSFGPGVRQQATNRARCPVQRPTSRPSMHQQTMTRARCPLRC